MSSGELNSSLHASTASTSVADFIISGLPNSEFSTSSSLSGFHGSKMCLLLGLGGILLFIFLLSTRSMELEHGSDWSEYLSPVIQTLTIIWVLLQYLHTHLAPSKNIIALRGLSEQQPFSERKSWSVFRTTGLTWRHRWLSLNRGLKRGSELVLGVRSTAEWSHWPRMPLNLLTSS